MTGVSPNPAVSLDGRVRAYVPALDGLRGLAIIGVVLFHTGHLPGGFLGVDLFFALSGYLITDLLLHEIRKTGRVSLTVFWGRRVRRLGPALAFLLAGVTVFVVVAGSPDLVRTTLADGPWVQANLVNWHLLAESSDYWDRFGNQRVFEHLWSVAVEEQFYLVWPFLLLLIARGAHQVERWVAVAAVTVAAVSAVLMTGLHDPAAPSRVYTGTDTRAFSLLLGAVVATAGGRTVLNRLPRRWVGPGQVVLLVALAAAWLLVDGPDTPGLFPGGLFAYAAGAALLIGWCVQEPGSAVSRVLGRSPLRWVGSISYSLYLWHWPVIVLLGRHPSGFGVCVVSLALACLSKYLVEDPVRYRAAWARDGRGAVVFVVVMLALALLWVFLPGPAAPEIDITQVDCCGPVTG
ncbi:acyltransferase family protein [Kineosporia succinea]|uniref:Peptidoglycan/LPS O-acetylase OafA/YrhL n=1 Tax=Kineosporia succinea TaxID=84632 RepID=A0ABT9P8L5_9ACTN|nr:acyltransferase [Kineosporia succinea]MDP9829028.1 peptidoglycan/LPS O-acetylase OafA/YrhL [Kineosporia succinea]